MKNLLNADFKDIIAEIKQSRKGAAMIICFICLCCAAIDFILRKHGINEDWFTHSYILIFFTALATWSIKLFNAICDIKDNRLKAELNQKKIEQKIIEDYYLLEPVLKGFENTKIIILRDFVLKKATKITIIQLPLNYIRNDISSINSYIYSYGYHIYCTDLSDFLIAEITPEFLKILELYFSEGL